MTTSQLPLFVSALLLALGSPLFATDAKPAEDTAATTALLATELDPVPLVPADKPYQPNLDVDYAGALTQSIALRLPEGTNGMHPPLSLDYNSSLPNGLAGVGFAVRGLSAITRDSSYPIKFQSADHYALDGEKLLYLNSPAGQGTFHREREDFSRIQAFRKSAPSTPVADPNAADAFWTVKTKEGLTYYYGDYPGRSTTSTNLSTVPALGQTKPRLWALSKVEDTLGNSYAYNYHFDTVTGAYYPVSIIYTQGAGMTLFKAVHFSYETRNDHGPLYQPTKVDMDRRLKWISVVAGTNASGAGGNLVRKYRLDYSYGPSTGRSRVTAVQEYGSEGSWPAPGYISSFSPGTEKTLPATSITYQDGISTFLPGQRWATATYDTTFRMALDTNGDSKTDILVKQSGGSNPVMKFLLSNGIDYNTVVTQGASLNALSALDANGDGKPDFLVEETSSSSTKWGVYLSAGSGSSSNWTTADRYTYQFVGAPDVNGDGRSDLLVRNTNDNGSTWIARLSDGTKFLPNGPGPLVLDTVWFQESAGGNRNYYAGTLDADGDGRQDLLLHYTTDSGVAWGAHVSNGTTAFSRNALSSAWQPSATTLQATSDFNGDGKDDLLLKQVSGTTTTWKVMLSDGISSFVDAGVWASGTGPTFVASPDLNGDGLADLLLASTGGSYCSWESRLSNGRNQFVPSSSGSSPGTNIKVVAVADVDGDGRPDLILESVNGHDTEWQVCRQTGVLPDLVTRITVPQGGQINVTYSAAPQLSGTVVPGNSNYATAVANASPRQLVTSVTLNPGVGPAVTTTYSYANALRKPGLPQLRADLGFQSVTKTVNGARTITTFDQTVPLRGLVTGVTVQDTASTPKKYLQTLLTWNAVPGAGLTGSWFQKQVQTLELKYDGLGDANPSRTKTTLTYDDATGSLTEKLDWGLVDAAGQSVDSTGALSDQAQVKEVYGYSSNVSSPNYLYRLRDKTVSSWDAAHTAFSTSERTEYFYDNQVLGVLGTGPGLLTKTQRYFDGTGVVATTWTYDAWGNVLTLRDGRVNDAGDPLYAWGDTEVRTYDDAYHALQTSVKNALWNASTPSRNLTTIAYDSLLQPTSITDSNGQTTTLHYDSFSRVDYTLAPPVAPSPADDATNPTTRTTHFDSVFPSYALSEHKTSVGAEAASYVKSYTYLDGLGRTLQTKRQAVGGWITQDWGYDASGRNSRVSVPYLSTTNANTIPDSSKGATSFTYDILNRVTMLTNPDTTTRQTVYLKTTTRFIDENLHVTETEDYGNVVVATKFSGTYPAQAYDLATNSKVITRKSNGLTTVTDNKGNATRSVTDWLGRRTQYQDADIGVWDYAYDANGNLKTRSDNLTPRRVVNYTYDKLNRLLTKTSASSTINTTYVYDETGHGNGAVGQLTSVVFNRGSDSLNYDERGRVSSRTRTLDTIAQSESYTYDPLNRVRTQILPDGEVLTSTYGVDGNLDSLNGLKAGVTTSYLTGATYTPLGKLRTLAYGNGVTTTYSYYDDGTVDPSSGKTLSYRLRQITAGTGNAVMNLSYSYYGNDNLASRTDANNSSFSETYTYDAQDRLTQAVSVVSGTQNYSYDSIDNLITKDGLTYSYGSAKPHAVTSIGTYGYTYNRNGNMIGRTGGRTIAYDNENRVISVSDGGKYAYDSERQRTIKTEGTKTTYYFFSDFEQEYISGSLSNTVKYYSANDQKIAQYTSTDSVLSYIHADHLGSSTRMTNTVGAVVRTQSYRPYGADADVTGAASTKYQYTGQEKDAGGLYYYNARYYDPELGRFVQPDPAVWDLRQSAQLTLEEQINPYLYAMNNPVVYTDPSGLAPIRALEVSQRATVLSAINSLSFAQYSFDDGGNLFKTSRLNLVGSKTYSVEIDRQLATGKRDVYVVPTGEIVVYAGGKEIKVDADYPKFGGGVTAADRERDATSQILVVVSPHVDTARSTSGLPIWVSPEQKLMHEFVVHAFPLSQTNSDPSDVFLDNTIREELGLEEKATPFDHVNKVEKR